MGWRCGIEGGVGERQMKFGLVSKAESHHVILSHQSKLGKLGKSGS